MSVQGQLFDDFDAAPVAELPEPGPGCLHGNQFGCPACSALVDEMCAAFAAEVAAGTYDAEGYTPADRRKQRARS